ncbi:MAG: hypothetical protein V7K46_08285 [Nostoc sp.]
MDFRLKFNPKDALASKIPVRASVFVGAASPSGEGEGVRGLANERSHAAGFTLRYRQSKI